MAKFSDKLSILRKERGLSQRSVAAELGISQALLSHYEKGIREPGLDFVTKICVFYDVSADYMLGLTDKKNSGVPTEFFDDLHFILNRQIRGTAINIKQLLELFTQIGDIKSSEILDEFLTTLNTVVKE